MRRALNGRLPWACLYNPFMKSGSNPEGIAAAGKSGYRELDHTADWALLIWAPDLEGLFAAAIEGMAALMVVQAGPPAGERMLELTAPDAETLLVDLLTEVLLANEIGRILLEPAALRTQDLQLQVRFLERPVENQEKEIKAVTFNELNIRETERGLETMIVFDV